MPKHGKKPGILIVEDEPLISKTLALMLRRKGFDVEVSEDGRAALERIRRETFDVILTDLIMPNVDGFTIIEETKKAGITTPIVVISDLNQESDISRAKSLGAAKYLVKSAMALPDMVKTVTEVIGQVDMRPFRDIDGKEASAER